MPAWAEELRITYDIGDIPVTITRDAAGTYQWDGLPYPGTVLYQPQNGVIYYQHPEDPAWHTITPAMLQGVVATAKPTNGPAWQAWQGQPTLRWNIAADAATSCQPVFASQPAAQMAGLTVADLYHVLTALQWLNAGAIPNPCERLFFAPADAARIGLPVLFTGPNGAWQLSEVVRTSASTIDLPRNATPVDDDVRLRLLLVQFSPTERVELLKKYGELPISQQVQAISLLLTQESLP